MAVHTPVRPPVNPSANPTLTAIGAADTIPVPPTGKVILIIQNTGGGANTVVIDDPTSGTGPGGATTPGNPDVTLTVAATTGIRHAELDCRRFRNANGDIAFTNSATAGGSAIVYGPYPE